MPAETDGRTCSQRQVRHGTGQSLTSFLEGAAVGASTTSPSVTPLPPFRRAPKVCHANLIGKERQLDTGAIDRAKRLASCVGLRAQFMMHEQSGKTTSQASAALETASENIIKTLVLHAPREDVFIACIILGSDRLDVRRVAELVGVKKLRFATPQQIESVTQFRIGGVPPVAVSSCDRRIIDRNVLRRALVTGAGGDEYCGMRFSPGDLAASMSLELADISA